MSLQEPLDIARYGPRLWWIVVASVAARFTAERGTSQALGGLLLWLGILAGCALARSIIRRGPYASVRARRTGSAVAILCLILELMRLDTREWLPALLTALLAIQAGIFIAAEQRLHAWSILVASFTVLLLAAAETHSPLFLLCAAWLTLMALNLFAMEDRKQRASAASFEPVLAAEARGGGLQFISLALLLTIPAYLFVPKPGGWPLDDSPATSASKHMNATVSPAPLANAIQRTEQLEELPGALPAAPIESSRRFAHPESGDYGEDFSIADVERRMVLANDVVLYARSSHSINLRGKVYDRFSGDRWSRTVGEPQRVDLDNSSLLLPRPIGTTRVEQSIEIVVDLDPTLVHAPGVQRLRFPAVSLLRYEDGVLVADGSLRVDTVYSVGSRLTVREGRYLLQEPPPLDLARYLQADAVSERLRELARIVTANAPSPLTKALALEQHLRTQYAYTYETLARQNDTPLDWFLFDTRRGHCEFFASALAMMLRSVGIPSRVATGFSLSDPNPITGFHEVRALDGHAWVEAYLPLDAEGEGWLMLEPTPFYPLPPPGTDRPRGDRRIAEQMDGYLERLATTRQFLEPDAFRTQVTVRARDGWRNIRLALQALTSTAGALGWMLPLIMVATVAASIAMHLLWVAATDWLDNRRICRCLDRLALHDARSATLLLAAALLEATAPRSFARRQDWTLREYCKQQPSALTAEQSSLIPDEFIEAFDAARYGSVAAPNAAASLAKVSDLVRERLRNDPWPRLRVAAPRVWRTIARNAAS